MSAFKNTLPPPSAPLLARSASPLSGRLADLRNMARVFERVHGSVSAGLWRILRLTRSPSPPSGRLADLRVSGETS